MLWKTSKGNFLLQWDIAPLPFIAGGLNLPSSEERFDKATTYYEITSSGKVIKKYGQPETILLEDKVVVSVIHRVIGDTLYHFYWSQASGHEAEIQIDKRLPKLQPYEGPLPFDPATVITAYERSMVQLAQDQAWKPPPSAVLGDTAGHTFRMFEMTVTHKYTTTFTCYDWHMGDDVTVETEAIDYHRYHLAIPSGWYHDDAFAAAVESKMREAIGRSLLKDHYQEQQRSLAFGYMFPSSLDVIDNPPVEEGYHSPHHYVIFNGDYSFKETSPNEYKEFLGGLRVGVERSQPPRPLHHQHCSICSQFKDWEHALEHVQSEPTDTFLPEAANRLKVVYHITRYGLQLKQCPECGTYYLYRSIYEFLIGCGGSYDEYFLVRLTDEVAADYQEGRRSEPPNDMY
jgi:hypothetical protein